VNKAGFYVFINRGYGTPNFKWCCVFQEFDQEFLVENHILFMKFNTKEEAVSVASFLNSGIVFQFIEKILFGTNGVTCGVIYKFFYN